MKEACAITIPAVVRVGSCDYAVEFVEHPLTLNDKECLGVVDFNMHRISINSNLGDRQQHELTFLHELLHAIVHERGLELENEELIVNELTRGLHQIIRDNPTMFNSGERRNDVKKEG